MRLGQLARQLEIRSEQIVEFLAIKNITIDPGTNTRLEDTHVNMILSEFAPQQIEPSQEILPNKPDEVSEPTPPESPSFVVEESAPTPLEAPELIKAPKVELPGLTVVGKIDLPEKNKKEAESGEGAAPVSEDHKIQREANQRSQSRNNENRKWRNPLAAEREKAEKIRRENEREGKEKDRQRRTDHYLKKVKPQAPTKSAKIFREETIEMSPLEPERPKTWWGRFMHWLNT